MASDVSIVNAALIKLGEQTITSLSEDVKPARLASFIYADIRDVVTRAHPWNSAMARAILAAATPSPVWGFAYAYNLPTAPDYCLRVLAVEGEAAATGRWKVEGRQLVTDAAAPLNIRYLKRITDVSQADPLWAEALSARLAMELAEPLGKSTSLQEVMVRLYEGKLREARSIDGQEGTPDQIEADMWIGSRL